VPDPQGFLLVAAAYALGCVTTGYYLVRFRTGQDVRTLGSGATGARNVGRVLGPSAFAATLAGDAAKGAVAVGAAALYGLGEMGLMFVTVAVFAGHVWPVQLGFRGGKGLATVIGAVVVVDYWIVIVALLVAAIAFALSKRFTLSGLVAVALAPVLALATGRSPADIAIGLSALVVLIFFTHRQNIRSAFVDRNNAGDAI
jgi:glycerol-3-phosphate acyltransferase PlsY